MSSNGPYMERAKFFQVPLLKILLLEIFLTPGRDFPTSIQKLMKYKKNSIPKSKCIFILISLVRPGKRKDEIINRQRTDYFYTRSVYERKRKIYHTKIFQVPLFTPNTTQRGAYKLLVRPRDRQTTGEYLSNRKRRDYFHTRSTY